MAADIGESKRVEVARLPRLSAGMAKAAAWRRPSTVFLLPIATLPLFLAAALTYAGRTDATSVVVMLAPAFFYSGYAVLLVRRVERSLARRQQRLQAELMRRADEFSPTQVRLSRQYFESRLAQEIKRSRRHKLPLCVVTLTTRGERGRGVHTSWLVELTARYLRAEDVAGRLGRHVYALCLPHTPPAGALVVVDRLRAELAGSDVHFGIAYLEPGRGADAPEMLRIAQETPAEDLAA
jgi:GGDEF domain-containing protein